MANVRVQLSKLWSPSFLKLIIQPLLDIVAGLPEAPPPPPSLQDEPHSAAMDATNNPAKQFFKKASEKMRATTGVGVPGGVAGGHSHPVPKGGYTKIGSPGFMKVALVCAMYQNALKTLGQLKIEILAGKAGHVCDSKKGRCET